ncbi:MAG: GNAT family N-acetyltransferase [Solirubrobacterales bacterium]
MDVELHRGPIEPLLADWERLHAADPRRTPFSSPWWATAWMAVYGADVEPWTLLARDAGGVVALAPLTLGTKGPVRMLRGLGTEPADFWDVLAEPEFRERALSAFARKLGERRRDWDLLSLDAEREATTPSFAHRLGPAGMRVTTLEPEPCPVLPLPGDFDEYLAGQSRNSRSNYRRHLKRLDEGQVSMRLVTEPGEFAAAVARWHDLRAAQWDDRERELYGLQTLDSFRDFNARLLTEFVPRSLAEMREFHLDGKLTGSYIDFMDDRSYYVWLGGFDPAHSKVGIGKIAVLQGIRSSIEHGRTHFDFTRGSEPYKYDFGGVDAMLPSARFSHGRPRSRAAAAALRLRERFRG